MIRVSKVYTLTSFDEQLYYLPALKVKAGGKTYQSKSLALKVLTVPVDTLHPEQFYPPKDVQDNPFQWSEWSPLFWLSVLLSLVLVCLAVYLRSRLKNNKPILAKVRIVKRVLPHLTSHAGDRATEGRPHAELGRPEGLLYAAY